VPGMTNNLKAELLDAFFRAGPEPTGFFLALVTSSPIPGPDTNTMFNLTEIALGNGYAEGGQAFARSSSGFPTSTEDDGSDRGIVELKDIVFTATGGSIPSSGAGARYAVLTDNNATVDDRKVYLWFDLQSDLIVSEDQDLQINNMTAELVES